jgi:hypothetical protein
MPRHATCGCFGVEDSGLGQYPAAFRGFVRRFLLIAVLSMGALPFAHSQTPWFSATGTYPLPCWSEASSAIGQLRSGGPSDVVLVCQNANMIVVYPGRGDGALGTAVTYAGAAMPDSVRLGDFNGDGYLDVVVGNYSGTISILLGNGTGALAPRVDYPAGPFVEGIAIADVNRDRVLDIVAVLRTPPAVAVLLGRGDATFEAPVRYNAPVTFGNEATSITTGDFNRDGWADFAIGTTGTQVYVFFGRPAGALATPALAVVGGASPARIVAGDFNHDGATDLAIARLMGTDVAVLMSRADETFEPIRSIPGSRPSNDIATADIDGDGILDLVSISDSVTVLRGAGDGTFQTAQLVDVPSGRVYGLGLGDINRDGSQDMAVSTDSLLFVFGNTLSPPGSTAVDVPLAAMLPVLLSAALGLLGLAGLGFSCRKP